MRTVDPVKHEEKRQQILLAAENCFRRKGFRGATIASICTEAQMSPGHLYHYFKSKEAIVAALTELHLKGMEGEAAEVLGRTNIVAAICEEFEKFWKYKTLKKNQNALLIIEVLAEASRNPAIAKILRHRNKRMEELIAALLRRGQELGQVDQSLPVEASATILLSVLDASNSLFVKNPAVDINDALPLFNRMIAQFLLPQAQQKLKKRA